MKVTPNENGNPQEFGEHLYWYFAGFDLDNDQVNKICDKFLRLMMQEENTAKRMYYGEARKYLKERGVV